MRKNTFKQAITEGRQQIGVWHMVRDTQVTEMLGGCGFDWVLIDCEHTPNSEADVLAMLQALNGSPAMPAVRPSCLNVAEIKRLLDVGAQTIIVPYVQTVEEAELAAAAVEYPPHGIRGVSGGSRSSLYGTVPDYFTTARDEICLIVQIETVASMEKLEEIAAVPGIDGIFIGPADLAASMGARGKHRPSRRCGGHRVGDAPYPGGGQTRRVPVVQPGDAGKGGRGRMCLHGDRHRLRTVAPGRAGADRGVQRLESLSTKIAQSRAGTRCFQRRGPVSMTAGAISPPVCHPPGSSGCCLQSCHPLAILA